MEAWTGLIRFRIGIGGGLWEDNINIDLQDVLYGRMDWIDPVQDSDRWRALGG